MAILEGKSGIIRSCFINGAEIVIDGGVTAKCY